MAKFSQLDKKKLQAMIREQPLLVDRVLGETAIGIVEDAQKSMGSSPPGASYKRGKIVHVASKAGYPPNVDTGALRASLRFRKVSNGYRVEDGMEYGYYLEVGTSRIKPRPFLRPAFERAKDRFIARIREGLK